MFTRDQAAHYLAAMIDGEGWVGEPKGVQNRAIRIANTDPVLIDAVIECCQVLGLHYTVTSYTPRKENWTAGQTVHISGLAAFETVLAEVPVRAPAKLDRIRRTIPTFTQPLDPEVLAEMYGTGMTQKDIAVELGVGYKRVIWAMRHHGIERRSGTERAESVWRSRRKLHGPTGRTAQSSATAPM